MTEFGPEFRKIFDDVFGSVEIKIDVLEMAKIARAHALEFSKTDGNASIGDLKSWMPQALGWLFLHEAYNQLVKQAKQSAPKTNSAENP